MDLLGIYFPQTSVGTSTTENEILAMWHHRVFGISLNRNHLLTRRLIPVLGLYSRCKAIKTFREIFVVYLNCICT